MVWYQNPSELVTKNGSVATAVIKGIQSLPWWGVQLPCPQRRIKRAFGDGTRGAGWMLLKDMWFLTLFTNYTDEVQNVALL